MKIILKKKRERRFLKGHQWIFSNEIDKVEDYSEDEPLAELYDYRNKFLGKGFYNKHSLIAFRLLTTVRSQMIDERLFTERIKMAFGFRNKYSRNKSSFRVVYGESDFLPGLIIDKYNNFYSVQVFSKGMEYYIDVITHILVNELRAEAVVLKNDFPYRRLEGLDLYKKIVFPPTADSLNTIIELDGIKYNIDLLSGQKTAHYLDQVNNRLKIRQFISKESKVLDLFCNDGGFAMNALLAGAENVIGVDISENSVSQARQNIELNKLKGKILFEVADIFDYLNVQSKNNKKYDMIILDPPSLTKSRKDLNSAINAYLRLNSKAMKLISPGGFLFSFSCSGVVSEMTFREIIVKSTLIAKRKVRVIDYSICSFDHCFLPEMEETIYLKSYLLNII